MSVKIRLTRTGRTNRPFYRIGVFDVRTRRDGAPIEYVGYHDPVNQKAGTVVKEERVRYWLSVGAQPSATVAGILKARGIALPEAKAKQARPEKKRRRSHSKLRRKAVQATKAAKAAPAKGA